VLAGKVARYRSARSSTRCVTRPRGRNDGDRSGSFAHQSWDDLYVTPSVDDLSLEARRSATLAGKLRGAAITALGQAMV
jgi:hypothetical protein